MRVLEKAINASKIDSEKKKIKHFLLEIDKSDRLNPLELQLGETKFTNLYDTKGTLSITDAPIFAWKNPEYSWFLISNYTAVLLSRWNKSTKKQLKIVDRKNAAFKTFIADGKKILESIRDGQFKKIDNVRFYLLEKEEVNTNKAMIGQMVAGHDLFGIHLFIVNKKILNDNLMAHYYQGLKTFLSIENDVIDVMFYLNLKGKLMVKYPKDGKLEETELKNIQGPSPLKEFIQGLAGLLINNPSYLIYPQIEPSGEEKINNLPFYISKNKTHLSVK